MHEELLKEVFFPFPRVRNIQIDMIKDVYSALKNKKSMILHAPTGIGKTVSVLAPSLAHAIKNELNVFFLTSRHTQHRIAIETLKEIRNIHGIEFGVSDIIGKKGMCLQPGISLMQTGDFHEFCKTLREEEKCEFYTNARNKNNTPSVKAKIALDGISKSGPMHVGGFIETGEKQKLCPYELALMNAEASKVIIADYSYVFNEYIRDSFLLKAKKDIEKSIIIVDEGHNLPARMRDMMTSRLTSFMIEMAHKEAKKLEYNETMKNIQIINNVLLGLADKIICPQFDGLDNEFGLVGRAGHDDRGKGHLLPGYLQQVDAGRVVGGGIQDDHIVMTFAEFLAERFRAADKSHPGYFGQGAARLFLARIGAVKGKNRIFGVGHGSLFG